MQARNTQAPSGAIVPDPDAFRAWLRAALTDLGLRPTSVSEGIGLGKNTLTNFLARPGRDLRLGVAARVERDLQARAQAAGTTLAPFGGGHV